MKLLQIFFGVIIKLAYVYGSFRCILGSILKVMVQNGDIFWVAKIINIVFLVHEIPDIFWGEG